MMSSGKNQIIRQEKIESSPNFNMPSVSLTLSSSLSKDSNNIDSAKSGNENSPEHSDKSVNSTLSPTHFNSITINENMQCLSLINNNSNDIPTKSPSMTLTPCPITPQNSLVSPEPILCTSESGQSKLVVNGSKFHISSALRNRLRRSKSPNPQKNPLFSNNSLPSGASSHRKDYKLTFFSKSCQEEELSAELNGEESPKKTDNVTTNECSNSLNTNKLKNLLAFNRQKSNTSSPKKMNYGLSVDCENDSNRSSPIYSKQSSIGSYEVDFEKLAKELILPSLNEPLTSFKTDQSKSVSAKPVLKSCKTVDISDVSTKKKQITRSDTNKH